MNPYTVLLAAIICEVFGSSMLKESKGFTKRIPSIGVILGMGLSFYLFSLALRELPLSLAYAIWSGVGTALTAIVGIVIWKENFNLKKLTGLVCIIGGVIVLRLSGGGVH